MALTLTIGGVDFLPQYKTNSADITKVLQNRGGTLSIEITKKPGQNTPGQGKEIILKDGSRFLFGGFITKVSPVEIGRGQLFVYRVEATDYTYILINKSAQKNYTGQTLKYIVDDLMALYVDSGYSLVTTGVVTGPVIDTVSFNHISLRTAFEKLAKITGYEWFVDFDKVIHFNPKTSASAPENITDTSDNHDTLDIETDLTQVRNSIIVQGGVEESAGYLSQTFKADGTSRTWGLRDKPREMQFIKVGGVAVDFGVDPLNEDTGHDFMFNYQEKYIRCADSYTTPTSGTLIEVSYKYEVPVIILLESASSMSSMQALEGGDGRHQYTITETSIKSKAEARQRALKELIEYGNPQIKGYFKTRTGILQAGSYFEPGQEVIVNSPSWGISTDTKYLIQEVRTSLVEDGSNIEYNYNIRFGGRLIDTIVFLESLASKEEIINADQEIDTIKAISETMSITETIERDAQLKEISETATIAESITSDIVTPPFQYGPGGSPQGKWNTSEWG